MASVSVVGIVCLGRRGRGRSARKCVTVVDCAGCTWLFALEDVTRCTACRAFLCARCELGGSCLACVDRWFADADVIAAGVPPPAPALTVDAERRHPVS